MKRRILLVDDEVAILLTLKAVLEISGFEVETAASAREARAKLRTREYHMIITDMRMENEAAGTDVIQAARSAPYHPAIALLTAFPVNEEGWDGVGPDKILVKATQTKVLLQQIDKLFASHAAKLSRLAVQTAGVPATPATSTSPAKSGKVATLSSASLASLAAAAESTATEHMDGSPGKPKSDPRSSIKPVRSSQSTKAKKRDAASA